MQSNDTRPRLDTGGTGVEIRSIPMQSTGNDPQDRQRYRLNTKAHPQRRRCAPINTLKKGRGRPVRRAKNGVHSGERKCILRDEEEKKRRVVQGKKPGTGGGSRREMARDDGWNGCSTLLGTAERARGSGNQTSGACIGVHEWMHMHESSCTVREVRCDDV